MSYPMPVTTPLRKLALQEADAHVAAGAAYVDLRRIPDYLDVHVPGSLALEYEYGPGMPGRARDCIPLEIPLILLDEGDVDLGEVTAGLRGKGFSVEGVATGGVTGWGEAHGTPASTETIASWEVVEGSVLDVGDPGASVPDGALRIPIKSLWVRLDAIPKQGPVVIAAGRGVRAALAVGILERAGIEDVRFWTTGGPRRAYGKGGVRRVEP